MEFEFFNEMEKRLSPLMVKLRIEERAHVFYLIADGSKSFSSMNNTTWRSYFKPGFAEYIAGYLREFTISAEKIEIDELTCEFKLGSIFDLLMNVKAAE